MLVNEKPLRRVSTAREKTLGWPVSTTESFFMDGERQEQEGWDPAKLQASEPDPERMFTSFDRVPRNRWPLFVVAVLALVVIGAVASARVPAARDIRRRTIASVSAWLPPLKWPTPAAQPAHAAAVAEAPPTPAPAEAAAAPATPTAVAAVPVSGEPGAASAPTSGAAPAAPVATAPAAAPATAAAAPATAAVPEPAAPVPADPTTAVPSQAAAAPTPAAEPTPSLSLIPWKAMSSDAASSPPAPPVRKAAPAPAPASRARPVASASTAHRGMVWSPKVGSLVPSTPAASDPAPEIIPPSTTDAPVAASPAPTARHTSGADTSPPIAATPAPTARNTTGMASPSQIEPPAFQPPPPERAAPATEPSPAKDNKAPVIE